MGRRVLILDTSVLCCWLRVADKEVAGPDDDRWDHARIAALIENEKDLKSTFVLPIATLIETGNHIAQAKERRFDSAGFHVEILTGDRGLKAHEPAKPAPVPRRRR